MQKLAKQMPQNMGFAGLPEATDTNAILLLVLLWQPTRAGMDMSYLLKASRLIP